VGERVREDAEQERKLRERGKKRGKRGEGRSEGGRDLVEVRVRRGGRVARVDGGWRVGNRATQRR